MIVRTAKFEKNIIAFIKAHQADVLGGLKPFTFPAENLADKTKPHLPVLYVTEKRKRTAEEDVLTLDWSITFRAITGTSSAAALAELTDAYHDALETLLKSVDEATLTAGANQAMQMSDLIVVDSTISEAAANENQTAFFQEFRMSAGYTLYASAY